MNHILLSPRDEIDDSRYRIDDHRADHVRTVLKSSVGDFVRIGLIGGPVGQAVIERISQKEVILKPGSLEPVPEIRPFVRLICALPRPQTTKKVLCTAAQMGVRELHFIRANRVEKSFFQSTMLTESVYMPFLLEGLAQARLTAVPEVSFHNRFKVFFEDTWPDLQIADEAPAVHLLADTGGDLTIVQAVPPKVASITIAIGPEGGWVPFEIEFMKDRGFIPVRLSRWPLRVETAVTAALSQVELMSIARHQTL